MGTLTGSIPSLPNHCPHKLPTSCRLTATPSCCACLDRRPHASGYSTYIDGVGLVTRATRWQKYCWFCCQFWNNRIAACRPRVDAKDTKIPEEPDQKVFLERWFEFHRNEAPREVEWKEVSPGHLPLQDPVTRLGTTSRNVRMALEERVEEEVDLERTLDDLLSAAAENEEDEATVQQSIESGRAAATATRALQESRLELEETMQQLRSQIEILNTTRRAKAVRLRDVEQEIEQAQGMQFDLQKDLADISAVIRDKREQSSRLARERRTAQHLERVFGTREEIQQQGSDYVSPLTSMFVRAYDRYRVAEEVRAEERLVDRNRDVLSMQGRGVPPLLEYHHNLVDGAREATDHHVLQHSYPQRSAPLPRTLDDEQNDRPPPKTEEEMTVKLTCKVCLQQRPEVATLPCGHLVMCSHCSDIVIPSKAEDTTFPAKRGAYCPLCKKGVKRLARIYVA